MYLEKKEEVHKPDVKFRITRNKRKFKFLIITTVALVLVLTISCIAYSAGFIPITEFLDVKKPVGTSVELNIDDYLEEYPKLNDMPNLDKIKKAAYGTDSSVSSVISDYTEKLEKEGYGLKYQGIGNLDGKSFKYYGFLKGLTAVVVILIPDSESETGYDTTILYATGNALDFKAMLDWYENQ